MSTATLNPRLQEIVDDFNAMAGKDRLQLLLEFSQELPALPGRYAEDHDLLERVPECQSPLFLAVEVEPDATVHLFFEAPPEAPTTRGFASILQAGLDGLHPVAVFGVPLGQRRQVLGKLEQQLQLVLVGHVLEVVDDFLQLGMQRGAACGLWGHGLSPRVIGTRTVLPHSVHDPS